MGFDGDRRRTLVIPATGVPKDAPVRPDDSPLDQTTKRDPRRPEAWLASWKRAETNTEPWLDAASVDKAAVGTDCG